MDDIGNTLGLIEISASLKGESKINRIKSKETKIEKKSIERTRKNWLLWWAASMNIVSECVVIWSLNCLLALLCILCFNLLSNEMKCKKKMWKSVKRLAIEVRAYYVLIGTNTNYRKTEYNNNNQNKMNRSKKMKKIEEK